MRTILQMGVRSYRDLIAWQLADAFKTDVIAILRTSPAMMDFRYRSQLLEASRAVSKDIAEGFLRYSAPEFARFLDYALGSLVEAEGRLEDGIALGYFDASQCAVPLRLARRCAVALVRLKHSQLRYAASGAKAGKTQTPRT